MSFAATWMDLEIIMLSEVSQTKTNIHMAYMWNNKKIQTNLFTKQKQDSQTYGYQKKKGRGRDKLGGWN